MSGEPLRRRITIAPISLLSTNGCLFVAWSSDISISRNFSSNILFLFSSIIVLDLVIQLLKNACQNDCFQAGTQSLILYFCRGISHEKHEDRRGQIRLKKGEQRPFLDRKPCCRALYTSCLQCASKKCTNIVFFFKKPPTFLGLRSLNRNGYRLKCALRAPVEIKGALQSAAVRWRTGNRQRP